MRKGSAAQAAVESKHPVSACDTTTVDTFSATTCRNGAVKKLAKRPALPSYVGSFDSVRLRLSALRMTVGGVTHSQDDSSRGGEVLMRSKAKTVFLCDSVTLW